MEPTRHRPVLASEVLRHLAPGPGRLIVDLTLGGGGHALGLLESGATVIGLDRDAAAVERTRHRLSPHSKRFTAFHRTFAEFGEVLDQEGTTRVDGLLMDLGLSSDQLDDPGRGFAFRLDGPLDLRFDPTQGLPAYELLAQASVEQIRSWLREFGELRRARGLARVLAQRAQGGVLRTTGQLRDVVLERVGSAARMEPELARVFQALRIVVNDELGALERALAQVSQRLTVGGRFVAISYHSLEDRRVKQMLRENSGRAPSAGRHVPAREAPAATMRILTPRVVRPTDREIQDNPRARSARLRAGERLP